MNATTKTAAMLLTACAALALGACNSNNTNPIANPTPHGNALGSPPYKQVDRLNRPAVNEVFATYAQHQANNADTPNGDAATLKPQIADFMTKVAGRSAAIAGVVSSVLTPDVKLPTCPEPVNPASVRLREAATTISASRRAAPRKRRQV